MRKMNKKGVLDNLSEIVTGLGVVAILAAIIFLVIAESQDQVIAQNPCGTETGAQWNATQGVCWSSVSNTTVSTSHTYNASIAVQSAASDIPSWLPIIVITVIGGILLGLVRFFKK